MDAIPAEGSVIDRIEHVVPWYIWVVMVGSLLVAIVGGIAAGLASRRARRQRALLTAASAAAMTDPLTGVLNRRGFIDALERELGRAERYGREFAVAYVDVRGFKAINDSHGHEAGDRVLREVAELLRTSARRDDVVGRLGGDELGVLLLEQSPESAATVAERIRSAVALRRGALALGSHWDLTVGIAGYPRDADSADGLLRVADERLYAQRGIAID